MGKEAIELPMGQFSSTCSPIFSSVLFICSLLQLIIPGLADSSSSSDSGNEAKVAAHTKSKGSVGLTVFLVILGLLGVAVLSVFLFKVWQKRKREEQQARLLKLFEQDDELEDELGLRD